MGKGFQERDKEEGGGEIKMIEMRYVYIYQFSKMNVIIMYCKHMPTIKKFLKNRSSVFT